MDFENILNLAERAAQGFDNFKNGLVGYNGYGFVLRDLSFPLSRKLCNFGSMGKFALDQENGKLKGQTFQDYNIFRDILIVGSIKSLIPSLILGGDEILFNAWMFVITSDGKAFPASLYYGSTRLAIGGWKLGSHDWFDVDSRIPEELNRIINCDPFRFSSKIKRKLVDSFEQALKKVPPSDFSAIFEHDLGFRLMGISDGKPLSIELGETPTICDIKSRVDNDFKLELNPEVFDKWDFL